MDAAFSARERATLRVLTDTLLPPTDGPGGLAASGTDLGTDERLVEVARDVLSREDAANLRLVLRLFERRIATALLVGRPVRFSDLPIAERETFLRSLATSTIASKRRIFQGTKRLLSFLHYTDARTWDALQYRPPAIEPTGSAPPLPAWSGEPVDAIVVGSGAGGGVAAGILARAGNRVLVVEAGPLVRASEFDGDEAEGHRRLYEGSGVFTTADESMTILAGRVAGGGTTVNWMTSLAPPPWLRAEWEASGLDGVAGADFDAHIRAVEARASVAVDESPPNGPNRVLEEGAKALGWSTRRLPRNARGCAARCGFCAYGCPFDAKQGTLVTWLADAAFTGARFAFEAPVERVLVERGRAVGVRFADGREARAPKVLLAGGAIQTAALLLRSRVRSRGIGRIFLHPATAVTARFDRRMAAWEGAMQTVAVDAFTDLDGAHHGFLLEAVPAHPGLSASALPWTGGRAAKEDMRLLANVAPLLVLVRDERPGRVRIDSRGRPRVSYAVGRPDAERMVRGIEAASAVARAAGAVEVGTLHAAGIRADPRNDGAFRAYLDAVRRAGVEAHAIGLFTAHQMGTCALGRDGEAPADGRTGRLFDVEGLYVVDGSAFPTPSGVNPMITIQSLAHRTAMRLGSE